MADIDFDRVAKLLTIVKDVAGVAPGFVYISGEAMAELRQIDQDIKKAKQAAQGQPVTPAPVGDPESPPQPVPPGGSASDFETHPLASQPLEEVKGPDVPPVDPQYDQSIDSTSTTIADRRI